MTLSPHQKRLAINAALTDLFSGSGEVDVEEVERAFQRQGLVVEEIAGDGQTGRLWGVAKDALRDAILEKENIKLVREVWTEPPYEAVAVDIIRETVRDLDEE